MRGRTRINGTPLFDLVYDSHKQAAMKKPRL
jgi:hypothetical protein